MKKIILFSLVFGLFTNCCYATYYRTTTNNCNTNAMMAKLNRATAEHRAVITEVSCDYTVPKAMPRKPVLIRPVYVYKPVVSKTKITVINITQNSCTCFDCGC